jgi:hypothetical protein
MPRIVFPKDELPGLPEPEYIDDDELIPVNQQKWKMPKEGLETRILRVSRPMVRNPKYTSHKEKAEVQLIARSCLSLHTGVMSRYPLEWVEWCIAWCAECWRNNRPMPLDNLVKYINNTDKMADWVARYCSEHKISLSVQGKI